MAYGNPAANFPGGMPGEPSSQVPRAISGRRQPSGKKVKVNQRHVDAVARRDAKLHKNAMTRYGAAHATPGGTQTGGTPADPSTAALLEAATRLRYGGQEQALGQQLNQNTRFTSGVPAWYANALAEIRGLQTQGQQSSAQTLGQIQNYNSPPTLPNNPVDAQAAQARNNLNTEYGAMFGRDAAANSAMMDRIAAAMVTQQGNTLSQANAQRQGLLGEQTALQGAKGDFKTTYGAQLNAAQAKSLMDQASLKVKQDTVDYLTGNAQSLAADRKAGQKVARTNARTQRKNAESTATNPSRVKTQMEIDYFNKHHRWPSTGPGGSARDGSNSTYSKSKIQGFRANWDYAQATAKQLKDAGTYIPKSGPNKGKVQNITTDTAYSALLNATKDPDIARAAAYLAFGKPVPPELLHTLAVKGIHPPRPKVGRVKGGGPYGTGRIGN